eukprot:3827694-Prymnesium_polylepis.2
MMRSRSRTPRAPPVVCGVCGRCPCYARAMCARHGGAAALASPGSVSVHLTISFSDRTTRA